MVTALICLVQIKVKTCFFKVIIDFYEGSSTHGGQLEERAEVVFKNGAIYKG